MTIFRPLPLAGILARALICAALAAAAGGLWLAGRAERQLADLDGALATLRFPHAAAAADPLAASLRFAPPLPWFRGAVDTARQQQAVAAYWAGDAAAVGTVDPLIAANLAFRRAQRTADRQALLRQLADVAARYAEVLKTRPDLVDAAYNYEYVTRLRTRLARARTARPPEPAGGAGLHGREGATPPDADTKPFKMFVPMQPDERKNVQPTAGKSPPKPRKG